MIANYHTHTPRCNHAVGSEEEYVQQALKAGIKILGFSDHTPYLFPGDYYSTFRMHPQELPGYVATVNGLKETYKGQLELHVGLEAEYYPAYFPQTLDYLREQGVEYLLLGQHFVGNEPVGSFSVRQTDDPALLERYCRQCIAAMETGVYTYIAHPDILNFTGSPDIYRQWMLTLIREARNCGVYLEFNQLGYFEKRNYPNPKFLELAAEENMPMILGCDAHQPEALGRKELQAEILELLKKYGIQVLDTVPLRHI